MTWSMSQKPIKKRAYLELIERRLVNRAAAIHCTSSLEQQQLGPWGFRPPSIIIPNGLDLTPFASLPERGELRRVLGVPQEGTLSLFVGRLHKMKRLERTIQAFVKVACEGCNLTKYVKNDMACLKMIRINDIKDSLDKALHVGLNK